MRQHGGFWFPVPRRRLGSAGAVAAVLLACSGCATVPDARCLSSRPAWSLNDAAPTKATKIAAARRWDRQCTLMGLIGAEVAAGW